MIQMQTTLLRTCKQCGKPITKGNTLSLYCSQACRRTKYRKGGSFALKLPTSTIGTISELRVTTDLLIKGYYVFRSVSPNGPCDLIAMNDNVVLRIEVSTADPSVKGNLYAADKSNTYIYDIRALVSRDGNQVEYNPALPNISSKLTKATSEPSKCQGGPPMPPSASQATEKPLEEGEITGCFGD